MHNWKEQLRYIADGTTELGLPAILDIDVAIAFIENLLTEQEKQIRREIADSQD